MNLRKRTLIRYIALAAFTVTVYAQHVLAVSINEIRISSPGATDDTTNFFELAGTPGVSLDDLTFLAFSSEFAPGDLDFVVPLAGYTIPADGHFLASTEATEYGSATDLTTGVDFWGSPTSFLLVAGFTGVEGFDYDSNDDGVLESTPWASIVDAVSISDSDSGTKHFYGGGPVVVGLEAPEFSPAHIERIPDGTGSFVTAADAFNDLSGDTPGTANIPEPASVALLVCGMAIALAQGTGRRPSEVRECCDTLL